MLYFWAGVTFPNRFFTTKWDVLLSESSDFALQVSKGSPITLSKALRVLPTTDCSYYKLAYLFPGNTSWGPQRSLQSADYERFKHVGVKLGRRGLFKWWPFLFWRGEPSCDHQVLTVPSIYNTSDLCVRVSLWSKLEPHKIRLNPSLWIGVSLIQTLLLSVGVCSAGTYYKNLINWHECTSVTYSHPVACGGCAQIHQADWEAWQPIYVNESSHELPVNHTSMVMVEALEENLSIQVGACEMEGAALSPVVVQEEWRLEWGKCYCVEVEGEMESKKKRKRS